jgi:prevent-host-death family protein
MSAGKKEVPIVGNSWPMSKAKANFAAFLRAAEKEPQIVTVRGKPKVEIRLLSNAKKSAIN